MQLSYFSGELNQVFLSRKISTFVKDSGLSGLVFRTPALKTSLNNDLLDNYDELKPVP